MAFSNPPMVAVPLRYDPDGTIRIGQTRILLEIVIHAFQDGVTPEAIIQGYPTLKLDDVYAVIAYYLQNRSEVDNYLQNVEIEAEQIHTQLEAIQPDLAEIRARMRKLIDEKKQI